MVASRVEARITAISTCQIACRVVRHGRDAAGVRVGRLVGLDVV